MAGKSRQETLGTGVQSGQLAAQFAAQMAGGRQATLDSNAPYATTFEDVDRIRTRPVDPAVDTGLNRAFRVLLPSRGLLYGDKLPNGVLELTPLTLADEAKLYDQGTQALDKIDNIIRAHIKSPIEPDELLIADRFFVLLVLRIRSHGGTYKINGKCQFCHQQFQHDINVAKEIETYYLEDGFTEPFEYMLPVGRKRLQLRFLRGSDERDVARTARRMKLKSTDAGDPSFVERLKAMIVAVDGQELTPTAKDNFVRNIDLGDSAQLQEFIDDQECGPDLKLFIPCAACGADNEMAMPFTADFFRPTSRKRS